ncbi:hypothetical protein GLOIN_2v1518619 [Rhizophagus irregularis DAOM 181602=DAOM 197198]|nr:hypothetical protein GLOIN_2v1518619 [Rhizophagus irregularis DAOM 181602=DAOM 197198]
MNEKFSTGIIIRFLLYIIHVYNFSFYSHHGYSWNVLIERRPSDESVLWLISAVLITL